MTLPSVLCVDDELSVLDGIERVLRSDFSITRVTNAADAMVALQYGGPYAVIISDLRLVETNGIQLLSRVREAAPDTVRLLLTGAAGREDTIAAINDGKIFGFVQKPCRPEVLLQRVKDAAQHHQLLVNERVLLEQTLRGSIKALTDLLALSSPVASAKAMRLTRYACDLSAALGVERWEIEVAAMVSQIGCTALGPELTDRICRGAPLTGAEREIADRLPLIAESLLASIPRLEGVRAILRHQGDRFDERALTGDEIPVGARVLRLVCDFDTLESRGLSVDDALVELSAVSGAYDPTVLAAFSEASSFFGTELETMEVLLSAVELGMVFLTDVVSPVGLLLIGRGQDVTPSLLARLRNHWLSFADKQRVRVVRRAGRPVAQSLPPSGR